ncbi:MAG TPA: tetratricopeptide repeat protein [Tepidisphaeraceae bacterium]
MKRFCPLILIALLGGCASHAGNSIANAPSTSPANSPSLLSLDEIHPRPLLKTAPTTAPSTPSLDAIELYAKARDAQDQNQRYTAITLLEKALVLDPDSFDLNYELGRAYLSVGDSGDRALAAFQRAAALQPDDLEVQTDLGREYQARGDLDKAIEHFRLAMQTNDYHGDDPLACVVDYRLAIALDQKGYDRAALQCYGNLLDRLAHPDFSNRVTPEIAYLLGRPELIYEEIGKLCEKLGDYDQALRAYQAVADHLPSDFDAQSRVVQTLIKLHRHPDAIAAATELVRRFHASPESIDLLREVYRDTGSEGGFTDGLRKLNRDHPDDRAILFALADTLASAGHAAEAEDLLWRRIESHGNDVESVQRLFALYADHDDVAGAAQLIIRITAAHPDQASELDPLFTDLLRLSRKNSLRPNSFEKIDVPPAAQSAKQYWMWHVATQWGRPAAAQAALDESAHANPPFDPACRALIESYFARPDWDAAAKEQAANSLIDFVKAHDRADFAAELQGLTSLHTNRPGVAAEFFANAVDMSRDPSPDLQLEYALALLRGGNAPRFEQLMWKLLSDRPRFEPAYQLFLDYFRQNNAQNKIVDVINTWLGADPNSINAKIQQAAEFIQRGRGGEALESIKKLFQQRPDDGDVVGSLVLLCNAAGQTSQAIELLENERTAHPGNRVAVEALVEIYAGQNRFAEATRILDAARKAVAGDPDLLYYVAHLYERVNQPQTMEQVLRDVLKIDPGNPQAGNDLGYSWADEGKNLPQAESLIRMAVDAEPDNPSYLDSLGWVLYKRGKFADATKFLQQASQPPETADPLVLNHLGDALYRANHSTDAQATWKRSLDRLGQVGERDDLKDLRLLLQSKLRQAQTGQTVNVAPVVELPAGKNQQAKD